MTPELDHRTIWLFRVGIAVPMLASALYHVARLMPYFGWKALLLLLIPVPIIVGCLWFTERKYVLRMPARGDFVITAIAVMVIGGYNFAIDYSVHPRDQLREAVDSAFNMSFFVPFMLFVRGKKDKQTCPAKSS